MQPTGSERDELLDRVYGRARALWWQRRVAPIVAVSLVLVALVTAPVLLRDSGGSPRKVVAIDQPTTTVAESTTTTEAVLGTSTAVVDAPPTTVPRTTTSLVCRNSFNERCGPFRWEPDPGANAPSTVTFTFSPAAPVAGQPVTIDVTVTNPDGPAGACATTTFYEFGDGQSQGLACDVGPDCVKTPYGPWTPPPRGTDSFTASVTHTYETPGSHVVSYRRGRGIDCDGPQNPYGDEPAGSATLTVSPAPA